ncbi:hypothetical protein Ancab_023622 [Ancistrocladus abbreviatus]
MTVSGPVIIIAGALCPGQSTCSEAVYLNGVQQTVAAISRMVALPILGQLADVYGRKPLLLVIISASIFPFDVVQDDGKRAAVFSWITGLTISVNNRLLNLYY